MYREVRRVQSIVEELQTHIRDALLATTTRDMVERSGSAQVSAAAAQEELERLLKGQEGGDLNSFGEPRVDSHFVDLANRSLSIAIVEAERVGLGVDVDSMRAQLIPFKTRSDFADAYLRAAIGADTDS
jgi:hypothetical protein